MSHGPHEEVGDAFHCHPDEASADRAALDRVFAAGVAARREGLTPADNPYAAGSEERGEWAAGWSATVEIEDEDPASSVAPVGKPL